MRIQESLNKFLPLRDTDKSTNFAHDSNKLLTICMTYLKSGMSHDSLATNNLILLLIWITRYHCRKGVALASGGSRGGRLGQLPRAPREGGTKEGEQKAFIK